MAHLTQLEFRDAVALLAKEKGLQRLRDRLVRMNALVSRRKVAAAETLADQLYMLTSGLRRQVPATLAFHGIWNESLNEKLGEENEKKLEDLAKAVNDCLTEDDEVDPEKAGDLDGALGTYAEAMAAHVGNEVTYLDMLLKAVPPVAARLRSGGLPKAPAKKKSAGRKRAAAEAKEAEGEPTDDDEASKAS